MKLGCTIAGHRADRMQTYNGGYYFGLCRRCGDYLIRCAHEPWRPVPRGHRVVWKAGRHSHSLEADFQGALPVACGGPPLLPRRPKRRRARALVPVRSRAPALEAPGEESDDVRFPRLLFLGVLCGAGVKMLLNLAGGR